MKDAAEFSHPATVMPLLAGKAGKLLSFFVVAPSRGKLSVFLVQQHRAGALSLLWRTSGPA